MPVVAPTIDDGPDPEVTPAILDVLRKHGARATFSVIGGRVEGNPELLQRMRAEGHEIGNHLWTDAPSVLPSPARFDREFMRVDALIQQPGGLKWFRPGFGWYSRRMLEQLKRRGYRLCLGSVDPHDTKPRAVDLISKHVLARVFPGGIVVLDDGSLDRMRTARVLESVRPELSRTGYRVVTLSELARLATASGSRP